MNNLLGCRSKTDLKFAAALRVQRALIVADVQAIARASKSKRGAMPADVGVRRNLSLIGKGPPRHDTLWHRASGPADDDAE